MLVRLQVGNGATERLEFVPKAAFAQYVELPGLGNELTITVAGYHASCDRFVPPQPGQASVSVLLKTPRGRAPTTGSYAWAGHQAHGGTVENPEQAYAVPSARIGSTSYVFPPGGTLSINDIRLVPNGHVAGQLRFEYPGDAESSAKLIKGTFRADICRFDEAPSRQKPGQSFR